MTDISKFDNIIDSRDVIKRIEELEDYEATLASAEAEHEHALNAHNAAAEAVGELAAELDLAKVQHGYGSSEADRAEEQHELALERLAERQDELEAAKTDLDNARSELTEDLQEELKLLRELAEQGEGYGDWAYGETLIHDSHFTAYAEQLAEDIGAVNPAAAWPLTHIDWEGAARDLKMDYTSIEFDGETFWMRS